MKKKTPATRPSRRTTRIAEAVEYKIEKNIPIPKNRSKKAGFHSIKWCLAIRLLWQKMKFTLCELP